MSINDGPGKLIHGHFGSECDEVVRQVRHCLLDLMAPLIQKRAVILTGSVVHNKALEEFFTEVGAREVWHIELDDQISLPIHLRLSKFEKLIANPPASIRRRLQAIDPTGQAIVYAGSYTAQSSFCERKVIGMRAKSVFEIERKDRQLEHVADHSNSRRCVVGLFEEGDAIRTVNDWVQKTPTIVSGIPNEYLAMGSSHTYLIQMGEAGKQAVPGLFRSIARDCSKAVLSTLDRGIPCTYYGFVSYDWVIDFGPFEALVFWNPKTFQLSAPGIVRPITLNDSQDRSASRSVHTVASRLNRKTGYIGAFCTDGAIHKDGYTIHEINPRVCAGFSLLGEISGGDLPFTLIDLALRARPAASDALLRTPLLDLARRLQVQKPTVKLWDARDKATQEQLRTQAPKSHDSTAWLAQVRQTLANGYLTALVEH